MIKTFLLDPNLIDKEKFNEEFYSSRFINFLDNIHPNTRKRGFVPVIDSKEQFIDKLRSLALNLDYQAHPEYQTELKGIIESCVSEYSIGGNTLKKFFAKLSSKSLKGLSTYEIASIDKHDFIDCFITNDNNKTNKTKKGVHFRKYDILRDSSYHELNKYKNSGLQFDEKISQKKIKDIFGKIILDSNLITFNFYKFFETIIKRKNDGSVDKKDPSPKSHQLKQLNHFKAFIRILIELKYDEKIDIFENSNKKSINIDILDVPDQQIKQTPPVNEVREFLSKNILNDPKIQNFHDSYGINLNLFILYNSDQKEITKIRGRLHKRRLITEYERISLNFNLDLLDDPRFSNNEKIGTKEDLGYSQISEDKILELFESKKSPETLKIIDVLGS